MGFQLTPRARKDLDEVWDYTFIESGSENVTDRALDVFAERFEMLSDWPRAGRARDDLRRGYRSFTAGDYVIVYRVVRTDVVILRIVHGRRDLRALFS